MRTPPCPYAHQCNGCQQQQVPYEQQLSQKVQQLSQLFAVQPQEITVLSDTEFSYRNRMEFIWTKKGLALRKTKYEYTPIQSCIICSQGITTAMKDIHEHFLEIDAFDPHKKTGTFKYCVIRQAKTICISFVLNNKSSQIQQAQDQIQSFAQKNPSYTILVTYGSPLDEQTTSADYYVVQGSEYLQQTLCDTTITYHAQSFFQNNTAVAQKMIDYVSTKLAKKNHILVDLYGGVGTFGITLAKSYEKVHIIEIDEQSINAANKNIIDNNRKNVITHCADASAIGKLPDITIQKTQTSTNDFSLIVDPPRSGVDVKTLRHILKLRPSTFIYISCNPFQLKKELVYILPYYSIKSIAFADMFPQTTHIEALVEFERKN
jgi:23S rRNA (uracil1939-C5)-methyltransferase